MKKILSICLVLLLLAISVSATTDCKKFDINKDGRIDSADVAELTSQGKNIKPIMNVLTNGLCENYARVNKCDKILTKQNTIQQQLLDLESNMQLTKKQQKLHDQLIIKADRLYSKYLKCLA